MSATSLNRSESHAPPVGTTSTPLPLQQVGLGMLRLGFGWALFWSGIDKVFGLGFATTPEQSVLAGVSPTKASCCTACRPMRPPRPCSSPWPAIPSPTRCSCSPPSGPGWRCCSASAPGSPRSAAGC